MLLRDVLPIFDGNKTRLAKELGITKGAVSQWEEDQPIPELQELKLKHFIIPYHEHKKQIDENWV